MLAHSVDSDLGQMGAVKVLIPEDIIGLKIQAISNDPSRQVKDFADIDALIRARRSQSEDVDWQLLKEYFELFDLPTVYDELAARYGTSN